MANVVINDTNLTAIGNAIREKNGTETKYKPKEMAAAILAIQSGGGEIPEEAFVITGDCSSRFANGAWDWFLREYGNRITTNNITALVDMFSKSMVTNIPFDININANSHNVSNVFNGCTNLQSAPKIKGTVTSSQNPNIQRMFADCQSLTEIDDDFFSFGGDDFQSKLSSASTNLQNMFYDCHSLRKHPDISRLTGGNGYNTLYYYGFFWCYVMDEIKLPVVTHPTMSSNAFFVTFTRCARLKDLIFETNEGVPYTRKWIGQTIDLSSNVGYAYIEKNITGYNSGITNATKVTDDASYQALKDNPDYWTTLKQYSRYNKQSALRTIQSLPDVSGGNSNTIKFLGDSGSATDGGAINTLTEEEIALATSKGWTVTFV